MYATSAIPRASQFCLSVAKQAVQISASVDKVYQFSIKYILLLRQGGFFILGPMEAYEGIKVRILHWGKSEGDNQSVKWKISHAAWRVLGGSSLLVSGVLGVVSEVITITEGVRTPLANTLFTFANGFFFIANIVKLKSCVDKYFFAQDLKKHPSTFEQGVHLERSALLGIFSSLNYIFCSLLLLFGTATTLAIVFCCIGSATSCFLAIHDWYFSVNQILE